MALKFGMGMRTLKQFMINPMDETVQFIQDRFTGPLPDTALVLGSGFGEIGDGLEGSTAIQTVKIPHWPVSTVHGHRGRLVLGRIGGEPVLALQGRVHYYEGYGIQDVVFPIRVLGRLGIRKLILTNAAGGIRPDFRPGDLMLITDHINFMGTNPLIGPNEETWGPRFPDMSTAYEPEYIALAEAGAGEVGVKVQKGVLAGMCGPSYETAAEIRMLKRLGADAVTMSTIPETITAVHMGMRVLGISFISNFATGVSSRRLSHNEVQDTARKYHSSFKKLVQAATQRISRHS